MNTELEKKGERIAKVMARAGVCSRRDAERYIADGRVSLNGKLLETPAVLVNEGDKILIDGQPMPIKEHTRVWRYHKPAGLVTSHKDPEGRKTVFETLPKGLPRVISIGRLDLNSEGLLLLTNDGAFARQMELPATGWLRRYRVRIHGKITPQIIHDLEKGVTVEGVRYAGIQVVLDKEQGANSWLTIGLNEGKNREVRRLMEHFGFQVTRLIRIAYGPFQLGNLDPGEIDEISGKALQEQVGMKIAVNIPKKTQQRRNKIPAKK